MKKFHKNLFFTVLVIALFFLSNNAYAQENGIKYSDTYDSTVGSVNLGHEVDSKEYNSARSQAVGVNTTVSNALIFLAPETSSGYQAMLESDTITPDMKRGLYGMATDSVNTMYESQPVVNVYAHLKSEWVPGYNSTTTIYAASPDSGYEELMSTGINSLWSSVLRITYVFFILIMIVVGFMIMFRSKLGGQTLVTLGNTLPNIILALVGATFSFAIAGLIIDLGGVIMVILVNIFDRTAGYDKYVTLDGFNSLFGALMPRALFSEIGEIFENVSDAFGDGGGWLSSLGISDYIAIARLPQKLGEIGLTTLIMLLVAITVGTVGVFKVFLTLIKAYLTILINVITGPIQIAMSAIPGKSANFINWAKNIFRAVLIYPITFAILNLPAVVYAVTDDGSLKLPGPDKLTLSDGTPTLLQSIDNAVFSEDLLNQKGINNAMLIFVLQIFIIFVAAKADKYAQAIVPPTTSREAGAAAEEAKRALSGIPFVGGLIK